MLGIFTKYMVAVAIQSEGEWDFAARMIELLHVNGETTLNTP